MVHACRRKMKQTGLGKASPYAAPRSDDSQGSRELCRAFDGMGIEWGEIVKGGLHASWWAYAFDIQAVKAAATPPESGEGRTFTWSRHGSLHHVKYSPAPSAAINKPITACPTAFPASAL